MAAEQDAARDRVLAARAAFDQELDALGASARDAVDIPAKIRRSPAKAAAIAGGVAFLLMRGPQRLWGAFRSRVFGRRAAMPTRMLPAEIEKTLDRLGKDGEKVRGTLERDFADYVRQRRKERRAIPTVLLLAAARPIVGAAARRAAEYLTAPPTEGPTTRIGAFTAQVGARAQELRAEAEARTGAARGSAERAAAGAQERVGRAAEAGTDRVDEVPGVGPAAGEPPTGA